MPYKYSELRKMYVTQKQKRDQLIKELDNYNN